MGGGFPSGVGLARSVRPVATPGLFEVEPILEVRVFPEVGQRAFWAETDFTAVRNAWNYLAVLEREGRLEAKVSREPIPVAVAVSDRSRKPRMVVFGDARFASNRFVRHPARYYDFLTGSIEWLAERPQNIEIKPKESVAYTLQLDKINQSRLIWLPLGLTLFVLAGLGVGLWVVRRR